jgi:hypothetical protein
MARGNQVAAPIVEAATDAEAETPALALPEELDSFLAANPTRSGAWVAPDGTFYLHKVFAAKNPEAVFVANPYKADA